MGLRSALVLFYMFGTAYTFTVPLNMSGVCQHSAQRSGAHEMTTFQANTIPPLCRQRRLSRRAFHLQAVKHFILVCVFAVLFDAAADPFFLKVTMGNKLNIVIFTSNTYFW